MSDFLQDEATAAAAAKAANATLRSGPRKRRLSAPRPKEVSSDIARSLQTLNFHLSVLILRSGGQLEDWLRVLPIYLIPLAVSAAVQDNSFSLHLDSYSMIEENFSALRALNQPALRLQLVLRSESAELSVAVPAAAELATLTNLQQLSVKNIYPQNVPSTLTRLTELRVTQDDVHLTTTVFRQWQQTLVHSQISRCFFSLMFYFMPFASPVCSPLSQDPGACLAVRKIPHGLPVAA